MSSRRNISRSIVTMVWWDDDVLIDHFSRSRFFLLRRRVCRCCDDERPSIFQPKATTSALEEAALAPGFVCVNWAIKELLHGGPMRASLGRRKTASPFDAFHGNTESLQCSR